MGYRRSHRPPPRQGAPMISYAIRYIAAPILGRFGIAVLHAGCEESDRADAAESTVDRVRGQLDEACLTAARFMAISDGASQNLRDAQEQIAAMTGEIETLRS